VTAIGETATPAPAGADTVATVIAHIAAKVVAQRSNRVIVELLKVVPSQG
jgi:hypothetical protein